MKLSDALNMGKPFEGFTIPRELTRKEKLKFIRQQMDEARRLVLPTLVIVHEWDSGGEIRRVTKYENVTPIQAYQIASEYDNKEDLYEYICQRMVTCKNSDNIVFCCICPYVDEIVGKTHALYDTTASGLYSDYLVSCEEI